MIMNNNAAYDHSATNTDMNRVIHYTGSSTNLKTDNGKKGRLETLL